MWDSLFSTRRVLAAVLTLIAVLFALGWMTRQDVGELPYLRIIGGGFIYNYRVSDVYYGFTAVVLKPIPTGAIVEAAFENPGGGPPLVVRQRMGGVEMTRFAMRSPPVRGVRAGRAYHVTIRLLGRETEQPFWSVEKTYVSQIDDDIVPKEPLTIGPGYARNPKAE